MLVGFSRSGLFSSLPAPFSPKIAHFSPWRLPRHHTFELELELSGFARWLEELLAAPFLVSSRDEQGKASH